MRGPIVFAAVCLLVSVPVAAEQTPNEVIEASAARLLEALAERRGELENDEQKLYALVDELLLPTFDTRYAAQRVLAKHWRTATAEQRDRFIEVFYNSLRKTYAGGLLEFQTDTMKVMPFRGDLSEGRAKVRTEVTLNDGTKVPVSYTMRKRDDGWKVWDVTIEGISYIKTYRTDFGAEVSARGLDALIERLETEGLKEVET